MRSSRTNNFRAFFKALPIDKQKESLRSYREWKRNHYLPKFHFKEIEINKNKKMWSVRPALGYRALGQKVAADHITWGWIGTHADYDKLINARRAKKQNIVK